MDAMSRRLLSRALILLTIIIGAVTLGIFGLSSFFPAYLQSPIYANPNGQGGNAVTIAQAQPNAGYLPLGAPPSQTTISTTTVSIAIPPSTIIVDNISLSDPASPVTYIVLNTTSPITYVELEIYQLSSFPSGVPSPSGTTFLILEFGPQSNLDKVLKSVTIEFKLPANATLQQQNTGIQKAGSGSPLSSSVAPSSLTMQRNDGGGSWVPVPTENLGSDGQYTLFRAQSPSLSLFAVTTSPESAHPFNSTFWSAATAVVVAFLVVSSIILTQHHRSKREHKPASLAPAKQAGEEEQQTTLGRGKTSRISLRAINALAPRGGD